MIPNKRLGYLLSFIHSLLALIPIYITLFSNDINMVLIMVFYWFMIIFLWYVFGNCLFTFFENKLMGEPNNDSLWFVEIAKKYNNNLGRLLYMYILLQPVVLLIIALFRIKSICKNK